MAKRRKDSSPGSKGDVSATCLKIAERGVRTSRDFRDFMSALMSDLIAGRVNAQVGNAACNAGGKVLKMVDLEYKYGTNPERKPGVLTIAFEDVSAAPALSSQEKTALGT